MKNYVARDIFFLCKINKFLRPHTATYTLRSLSGFFFFQVTWMKDGVLMSSNVDPNVRTLAEGRRLEIANARVTDRGRYVCVGENIAGRTQRDFVVNVFGRLSSWTKFTQLHIFLREK